MISPVPNNRACQRQANDPTDRLGGEDVSVVSICVLECSMNGTNEWNRKHCTAILDRIVALATRASAGALTSRAGSDARRRSATVGRCVKRHHMSLSWSFLCGVPSVVTPLTQLCKPIAFTICKKVQICMTGCILINALSSLSLSLLYSDVGVWSQLLEHTIFDSCQARVGDITERGHW